VEVGRGVDVTTRVDVEVGRGVDVTTRVDVGGTTMGVAEVPATNRIASKSTRASSTAFEERSITRISPKGLI